MLTLVCGGRDFHQRDFLFKTLDRLEISFLIQGGAPGADTLSRIWAEEKGIPCATVHANWRKLGKKAGPIRNGWMLLLKPSLIVAFHGGRGTENMVRRAIAMGYAPRFLGKGVRLFFWDFEHPGLDSA